MTHRKETAGLSTTTDSVEQTGTKPLPIVNRKGLSSVPDAAMNANTGAETSASAADLQRVAHLAWEIAGAANNLDRWFFHNIEEFSDHAPALMQERLELELTRIRSEVCRMGWLADMVAEVVDARTGRGTSPVREGGAAAWLVAPCFLGIGSKGGAE